MTVWWHQLRAWGKFESGQDVVEYALLCSLLTLVVIGLMMLVGPYFKNAFMDVINAVNMA